MTLTDFSLDIESDDRVLSQYESLRLQALSRREVFYRRSLGLALFMRKGMLAWVEVCNRHAPENVVAKKRESHSVFAFETTSEMIEVMANITLFNLEEALS